MESNKEQSAPKSSKRKNPKQIILIVAENIIYFITEIAQGDKVDFESKIASNYVEIFPANLHESNFNSKLS